MKLEHFRVKDEDKYDDSDIMGGRLSLPTGDKEIAYHCIVSEGGISRSERIAIIS